MSENERAVPRVPSARADSTDPNDGSSRPYGWSDMPASASRRHVHWRARLWTMLDMAMVPYAHGMSLPAACLPGVDLGACVNGSVLSMAERSKLYAMVIIARSNIGRTSPNARRGGMQPSVAC